MEEMETTKVIIDTDTLIDVLRSKKEAVALVSELELKKFLLATTAVNAFELYYGARKSNQPEKGLQSTKILLSRLVILPFTLRSAQKAGRIYAELEKTGQPIGLRDSFVAGIALTRGFAVVTRNIQHFRKITGLRIISGETL
jgi:predicted nucleic acid-binding protein